MTFKDYRDIIRSMEREMVHLTDDVFRVHFDRHGGGRFWVPSVDIHETQEMLIVKCELAGVKADDLQVSLSADDKTLTIAGIRREARDESDAPRLRCHQLEVYFGPFERDVPLPPQVRVDRENIAASYRDGFLTITLPKLAHVVEAAPRRIPIVAEAGERIVETGDGAHEGEE